MLLQSNLLFGKEIKDKNFFGISFPPFADEKQIEFTLKHLKTLNINKIRIAIDWRYREPTRGAYYWYPMDMRMKAAEKNDISVLLSVHDIEPEWAYDKSQNDESIPEKELFEKFIREVLKRYKIYKIQFGNEWEKKYLNEIEKFVEYNNILYHAVKEISPDTIVVLGGITKTYSILKAFYLKNEIPVFSDMQFQPCYSEIWIKNKLDKIFSDTESINKIIYNVEYVFKNAQYDEIDIHLYDDYRNWNEYLSALPEEKPIIVSEFGGPNSEFERIDQEYQADKIRKYLQTVESLPIKEAYYFKLMDSDTSYHKHSGLFDKNFNPKKSYWIFAEFLCKYK